MALKHELLGICFSWAGTTTLDKGRALMSPAFAMELLENTWIKLLSINKI